MHVTVDTNILVRAVVEDDEAQARLARRVLADAQQIVIPSQCLCEFVWVLTRFFKYKPEEIAAAIRLLASSANVLLDDAAVAAGLAVLEQGGDFADGVIAFDGRRLGGDTFVSFDRRAVRLLREAGFEAQLPS